MAIYHFSAKVISRASGSSALAAAAYRSASRLHDRRLDRHHDFSNKAGVVHSEVLLPDSAPEHLSDREQLWNAIEAAEVRKDAQLAREVEFALPRELDQAEGIRLARDFVEREFVSRGMIADLNVHWDFGADGSPKPHAHVMLSMREVGEGGFGAKVREWNRTGLLSHWREAWADHVNTRLAELDIDALIDHRSLEAQGIDLEPQHKIGPAASRMTAQGLESERADEHTEIARRNGARILADPSIALDAITHQQATFTSRDLARFVHRHSDEKEQFDRVFAAVKRSPGLVKLGKDGRGQERFTSRAMIETEKRLEAATVSLDASRRHAVGERDLARALVRARRRGLVLSHDQRGALEHATSPRGLGNAVGYAGSGKSAMLGVAREAWELAGYKVKGAALSGIAAENLEAGSCIVSRTLASLEHQWNRGRELLTERHVLVIDEAGMIGTRQMERVLAEARKQQAKVVLVGDVEQLQAIEAGAAFRSIAERHGAVEITEIRRQNEGWQRDATRQLATGRTAEALDAYNEAGHVHAAATREQARIALIDSWDRDRRETRGDSRIILTHTNDEVCALNEAARAKLREAGELGDDVRLSLTRGTRAFASGDRIMFLRNERGLGVKNGSLGTVRSIDAVRMRVLLDDGRLIAFDHKDYADIDRGYAATIHKAQGMTIDRVHVLATTGLDRHAAYVALSRHRDGVDLHYGRDDFADEGRLIGTLSRERGKDMASDYAADQSGAPEPSAKKRDIFAELRLRAAPRIARPAPDQLARAVERFGRAAQDIVRMRGGTRVEVKLKTNPFEPEGLLYRKNIFDEKKVVRLSRVIAAIAPACDVAITVTQDDEAQGNTAAGDWLEISSATLSNRIKGDDDIDDDDDEPAPTTKPWERLTELRDEDGKLYGRARIDAANQWWTSGLVTVDGLAASKIGLVAGILIGVETTASRNSASPIVPAPVLASWSSEQAIVIAAAEIPDAEKAQAAAIVMACGGDVAELPVVWWQEEWMTASQFVDAIKPLDRLEVYEGSISHEDDDDVTKREFESSFKANAKIAQTVDGRYGRLRDTDWIASVTQGNGSTPLEVVEALLCEAWGQAECDEDTLVVGEANGAEIYRTVAIYTPASEEDEDAN